jgi:hypothetical protein
MQQGLFQIKKVALKGRGGIFCYTELIPEGKH